MTPRTIVITGASDGIGAEAAAQLTTQGHRVVVVGRSPEKTAAIASRTGAEHLVADFTRLDDVRRLAAELLARTETIDVLANNAGGVFGERTLTPDGHETTFQVNHLGPFLLTELLLPRLLAGDGVVVNTSSAAHHGGRGLDVDDLDLARAHSPGRAYAQAKLANVLHARGLHARHHHEGLSAVAFHPGVVATSFGSTARGVLRAFYALPPTRALMTSAADAGAHLAWFCTGVPGQDWHPGAYYDKRRLARPSRRALDDALVDGLWRRSAEMVGLAP